MQAKAFAFQRNKEKKKRIKEKEGRIQLDLESDTLTDMEGASVQYSKYLMIFVSKNERPNDTLIITHSSEYKDIMEAGKSAIDHLVRKIGPANIDSVKFKQVRLDQADKTETLAVEKQRTKVIRLFLIFTGIPETRISLGE